MIGFPPVIAAFAAGDPDASLRGMYAISTKCS